MKKRGKKLLGGVKNFWFWKYKFSALICTKNHCKILKTRQESSLQSIVWKWCSKQIEKKRKKLKKIFWIFLNFFHKMQISIIDRLMSSHHFEMNFGAKESWNFTFEHAKVFTPPKSFLPPFLSMVYAP